MTIRLALIKIPVSDLARSVDFYKKALGLKAAFMAEEYGWAQLEGADFPLALYVPGKGGGDRAIGGSTDFHFASGEIESIAKAMTDSGLSAEVFTNNDGSASLEFADPDGNQIKIMKAE